MDGDKSEEYIPFEKTFYPDSMIVYCRAFPIWGQ